RLSDILERAANRAQEKAARTGNPEDAKAARLLKLKAFNFIDAASVLDRNNPDILARKAFLLASEGKNKEAEHILRVARGARFGAKKIRSPEVKNRAHLLYGKLLEDKKEYRKARKEYKAFKPVSDDPAISPEGAFSMRFGKETINATEGKERCLKEINKKPEPKKAEAGAEKKRFSMASVKSMAPSGKVLAVTAGIVVVVAVASLLLPPAWIAVIAPFIPQTLTIGVGNLLAGIGIQLGWVGVVGSFLLNYLIPIGTFASVLTSGTFSSVMLSSGALFMKLLVIVPIYGRITRSLSGRIEGAISSRTTFGREISHFASDPDADSGINLAEKLKNTSRGKKMVSLMLKKASSGWLSSPETVRMLEYVMANGTDQEKAEAKKEMLRLYSEGKLNDMDLLLCLMRLSKAGTEKEFVKEAALKWRETAIAKGMSGTPDPKKDIPDDAGEFADMCLDFMGEQQQIQSEISFKVAKLARLKDRIEKTTDAEEREKLNEEHGKLLEEITAPGVVIGTSLISTLSDASTITQKPADTKNLDDKIKAAETAESGEGKDYYAKPSARAPAEKKATKGDIEKRSLDEVEKEIAVLESLRPQRSIRMFFGGQPDISSEQKLRLAELYVLRSILSPDKYDISSASLLLRGMTESERQTAGEAMVLRLELYCHSLENGGRSLPRKTITSLKALGGRDGLLAEWLEAVYSPSPDPARILSASRALSNDGFTYPESQEDMDSLVTRRLVKGGVLALESRTKRAFSRFFVRPSTRVNMASAFTSAAEVSGLKNDKEIQDTLKNSASRISTKKQKEKEALDPEKKKSAVGLGKKTSIDVGTDLETNQKEDASGLKNMAYLDEIESLFFVSRRYYDDEGGVPALAEEIPDLVSALTKYSMIVPRGSPEHKKLMGLIERLCGINGYREVTPSSKDGRTFFIRVDGPNTEAGENFLSEIENTDPSLQPELWNIAVNISASMARAVERNENEVRKLEKQAPDGSDQTEKKRKISELKTRNSALRKSSAKLLNAFLKSSGKGTYEDLLDNDQSVREKALENILKAVRILYGDSAANILKTLLEKAVKDGDTDLLSAVRGAIFYARGDLKTPIGLSDASRRRLIEDMIRAALNNKKFSLVFAALSQSAGILDVAVRLKIISSVTNFKDLDDEELVSLCLLMKSMIASLSKEDFASRKTEIASILTRLGDVYKRKSDFYAALMDLENAYSNRLAEEDKGDREAGFNAAKSKYIEALKNERKEAEKKWIKEKVAEAEKMRKLAETLRQNEEYEEAEKILTSANNILNSLIDRNMSLVTGESPREMVDLSDVLKLGTTIAADMDRLLIERGKYRELFLWRAEGSAKLAEFYLLRGEEGDKDLADKAIESAQGDLLRAIKLAPSDKKLRSKMREVCALKLSLSEKLLKRDKDRLEKKEAEIKRVDEEIEKLDKSLEDIALQEEANLSAAQNRLEEARKTGDAVTIAEAEANVTQKETKKKEIEEKKSKAEAKKEKAEKERKELEDAKEKAEKAVAEVKKTDARNIALGIKYSFDVFELSKYDLSDADAAKEVSFLASLSPFDSAPDDIKDAFMRGVSRMRHSIRIAPKGKEKVKVEEAVRKVVLDVYFGGDGDKMLSALDKLMKKGSKDSVDLGELDSALSDSGVSVDVLTLINYVSTNIPENSKEKLLVELNDLYVAASPSDPMLKAGILAEIYTLLSPASDSEISSSAFEKADKDKQEGVLNAFLDANEIGNPALKKDISELFFAERGKKDKDKKWDGLSYSERSKAAMESISSEENKENDLAGLRENNRFSSRSELKREALEETLREELKKAPENRDEDLLQNLYNEMKELVGEDDDEILPLFKGALYYGNGTRAGSDGNRKPNYSRLDAIRNYKARLEKDPNDAEAMKALSEIYEARGQDIFPGNKRTDGVVYTEASEHFSKHAEFLAGEAEKEADAVKKSALVAESKKYSDLATRYSKGSASQLSRSAATLVKLYEITKDEKLLVEAKSLLDQIPLSKSARRSSDVYGSKKIEKDVYLLKAKISMTKISMREGDLNGALTFVNRARGRRFFVFRAKPDAETAFLIGYIYAKKGNMRKAKKFLRRVQADKEAPLAASRVDLIDLAETLEVRGRKDADAGMFSRGNPQENLSMSIWAYRAAIKKCGEGDEELEADLKLRVVEIYKLMLDKRIIDRLPWWRILKRLSRLRPEKRREIESSQARGYLLGATEISETGAPKAQE
ncbi:MAG TPA: hypothetical protein PKZ41_00220, partial [Candidatus Omnitrophota bacterium]|nr:hypothetical protein [Candidatus Omnitrophota bacterium]